ncbi:MAG: alpha/beta hydrolase [Pseudomonadota bacterium]
MTMHEPIGAAAGDYACRFEPGEGAEPLTLVMLHGTGGDADEMAGLGRALARAAGVPGAAVLSLQGDVSEGGAARFFRRTGEGRYDMADLRRATEKMAAFLPRALAQHGRDPARAVAVGFSNGANMAASVMLQRPDLLGGWVLMHPLIPFRAEMAPATGARVLITAGERDPICPPAATRALVATVQASGATLATYWYPGGHQPTPAEVADIARWLTA